MYVDFSDAHFNNESFGRTIYFNFSELPESELILKAELKFSAQEPLVKCKFHNQINSSQNVHIQLFEFNGSNGKESISNSTFHLRDGTLHSFSMDITSTIKKWQTEIRSTHQKSPFMHTLLIFVTPVKSITFQKSNGQVNDGQKAAEDLALEKSPDCSTLIVASLEARISIYNRKNTTAVHKQSLVEELRELPGLGNAKLEDPNKKILQSLIQLSGYNGTSFARRRQSQVSNFHFQPCMKRELYVNFKEIGLDNIHAPEGFNAYFCAGICRAPLEPNQIASNHAIVQSIVKRKYPRKIPRPCCVPTHLSPLQVFISDKATNSFSTLVLQDMIIDSCGCA